MTTSKPGHGGVSVADVTSQVEVLRLSERYFDSLVLFALRDCGALEVLSHGPATFDEMQASVTGDARALRAVLDAAVAVGILSRGDGRYKASDVLLDTLVRRESAAYIGEFVGFLHDLVAPLSGMGGVAAGRTMPASEGHAAAVARAIASMDSAMDAIARSRTAEFVERVGFAGTRHLLDVGCGPASYALAVLGAQRTARATLLDWPGPLAVARARAAETGLSNRIEFVEGDARTYATEARFDTVVLSHVLHMLGPDESKVLLRRLRGFVSPGGRLVIQAQFLNEDRTSPRWPALLNLIEAAITPLGRNHTTAETTAWMTDAGFVRIRHIPFATWNPSSCLVGEVDGAAVASGGGR